MLQSLNYFTTEWPTFTSNVTFFVKTNHCWWKLGLQPQPTDRTVAISLSLQSKSEVDECDSFFSTFTRLCIINSGHINSEELTNLNCGDCYLVHAFNACTSSKSHPQNDMETVLLSVNTKLQYQHHWISQETIDQFSIRYFLLLRWAKLLKLFLNTSF